MNLPRTTRLTILMSTGRGTALALLIAALAAGCAGRNATKEPRAADAGDVKSEPVKPRNVNPMLVAVERDFFVPANEFDKDGNRNAPQAAPISAQPTTIVPMPFKAEVLVYHASASAAYFKRGGVDGSFNQFVWERFLRKYALPYRVLKNADALTQARTGVLVLPSDVALSAHERQAIADFRRRGGSVFASWMVGTRDESGTWQGFGYMESLLGIRIVGNTAPLEEERYLNPFADTEVTHSLPAGTRLWTERVDGYWILRVAGRQHAALVTNWSRAMDKPKVDTVIAYHEDAMSNGASSRMVYFGWPERLWLATDPRKHEALLYDSMIWLLRQPAAYLATWPHPYHSAYMPIIYMADVFNDNDIPFANQLKQNGLSGSYYILGFEIEKSADALKKIQSLGHQLGYEADIYEGFKGQPIQDQSGRLDKMRSEVAAQKLPVSSDPGFAPPMDDADANTRIAAARQPYGHMIAWIDTTDGCTPYLYEGVGAESRNRPLVIIPRLQPGAEEMLEDVDEDAAIASLGAAIDAADRMGCLTVARFANQSLLSSAAKDELLGEYVKRKQRMWGANGSQVAHWWLQRERIKIDLTGTLDDAVLSSVISGGPVAEDAIVWVNLPTANASPDFLPLEGAPALKIVTRTSTRVAVSLRGLPSGQHRWRVRFSGITP